MREFVIMADVNTDCGPEYIKQENITILPQYYHFDDGIIYGEERFLESDVFYERLNKGERAYSMGCNPDTVRRLMEEELKKDHDIIAIMASSECSSSYHTVLMEAEELLESYPGAKIHVVDTYLEATPAGLIVYMAQEMKKKNCTFDEVVKVVEEHKADFNILFIVDDLKYLVRGGRLGVVSGTVGTLLNIKPILTEGGGLIIPYTKCRGKNTAKNTIIKRVKEMNIDRDLFAVVYTHDKSEADEFAEIVERECGIKPLFINEINPTIGAHIGPGGVGVCFCKLPD